MQWHGAMLTQAIRGLLRGTVCVILLPLATTAAQPSVVVQWNQALLQAVRNSRMGPPMVARAPMEQPAAMDVPGLDQVDGFLIPIVHLGNTPAADDPLATGHAMRVAAQRAAADKADSSGR